MEMELVVADDNESGGGGGGNSYDDYDTIDVAISNADVTPSIATKCAPALQRRAIILSYCIQMSIELT